MRVIDGIDDSLSRVNLMELGADPLDPYGAYDDMRDLSARIFAHGDMQFVDTLMPINSAKAILGLRYSAHVPMFLDVIDKYGSKEAFDMLSKAESFDDIAKML